MTRLWAMWRQNTSGWTRREKTSKIIKFKIILCLKLLICLRGFKATWKYFWVSSDAKLRQRFAYWEKLVKRCLRAFFIAELLIHQHFKSLFIKYQVIYSSITLVSRKSMKVPEITFFPLLFFHETRRIANAQNKRHELRVPLGSNH